MQDLTPFEISAIGVEAALVLCGLFTLWKLQFSPAARLAKTKTSTQPLTEWKASIQELAILVLFVICGGFAGQLLSGLVLDLYKTTADAKMIISGLGFQLGMLSGVALFTKAQDAGRDYGLPKLPFVKEGALAFLALMPLIYGVGAIWSTILHLLDIELERQELVDIFRNTNNPGMLSCLMFIAVVIAPLTEELIFRAGLFRFLRTRAPRWVAFLVPALLFGALHANMASFPQLVCLGILFSIAYERTGNIAVPMLAHALFNLNTIMLIIAGIDA